jgi:hypothetical protein
VGRAATTQELLTARFGPRNYRVSCAA